MRTALSRVILIVLLGMTIIASTTHAAGNLHGLDLANFDTTVLPCTNFYQYANGGWLKNNPIPPEYSSWGVWHEMLQRNYDMLKQMLEDAAAKTDAPKGSNLQKIGDLYASAMDTVKIEAAGIKPAQAMLDRIAAVKTTQDLLNLVVDWQSSGTEVLFGTMFDRDAKNSSRVILYSFQSGLGLPDRDYYLRTNEESKKLRDQYVEHITNMFVLLGDSPEKARLGADKVMALETKLAEGSLATVDAQDPKSYYALTTMEDAAKAMPHFSWKDYFAKAGHPEIKDFSLGHTQYFLKLDTLLVQTPVEDWKMYLRWQYIESVAPYLSSAFVNENFRFTGTILSGTKKLKPRWKRALEQVSRSLGEAVGEMYVAKVFPPQYKTRALEMVQNLEKAFRTRIQNLDWMSDTTKQRALAKLASFTAKIGYPDKWIDYSALTIDRSDLVANVHRAAAFEFHRQMDKIGKPVDKTEWTMSPQTINAYFNPLGNEIVFPAAIMQPPFFDGEADDAMNYGAMGAIMGHEMSHGFDNHGCQFDANGEFNNWWTEADLKQYQERSKVLVKQFDDYVAVDSLHVNGELTLGENIGDLGGLSIAYDGLQLALQGKDRKLIDGFTPEQRFFLAWAQAWRENTRPEALKVLVNSNEHAPGRFRVPGPFSNMPQFFQAFGCKPGDPMVRDQKDLVRIW